MENLEILEAILEDIYNVIKIDSGANTLEYLYKGGHGGGNVVYSEEKGLWLGAVNYITKPYNPQIIRVKICNHIELKTLRDNLSEIVAKRTRQFEKLMQKLFATHIAIIMEMSLLLERVTG